MFWHFLGELICKIKISGQKNVILEAIAIADKRAGWSSGTRFTLEIQQPINSPRSHSSTTFAFSPGRLTLARSLVRSHTATNFPVSRMVQHRLKLGAA